MLEIRSKVRVLVTAQQLPDVIRKASAVCASWLARSTRQLKYNAAPAAPRCPSASFRSVAMAEYGTVPPALYALTATRKVTSRFTQRRTAGEANRVTASSVVSGPMPSAAISSFANARSVAFCLTEKACGSTVGVALGPQIVWQFWV